MAADAAPAAFIYDRPISLASVIAFSSTQNIWDRAVKAVVVRRRLRATTSVAPLMYRIYRRVAARELMRSDRGPYVPERRSGLLLC
jgi:hypothetical protein